MDLVTLFVDNLHPQTDQKSLAARFSHLCVIKDVFISRKRREGRKDLFGFVRVATESEAKMLIHRCGGATLFGRRLMIKMARFGREIGIAVDRFKEIYGPYKGREVKEQNQGGMYGRHAKDPKELIREEEVDVEVLVQREGALEWLQKCAVGKLRKVTALEDIIGWTEKGENVNAKIRSLGGDKVLLEFSSNEKMKECIAEENQKLGSCFSSIKPWNQKEAARKRCIWIRCMDVPLQVWGEKFFRLIGNLWGMVIKVEEETLRKEKLEVGRVLIATNKVESINSKLKIGVDGETYIVRVAEDLNSGTIEREGLEESTSPEDGRRNGICPERIQVREMEPTMSSVAGEHHLGGLRISNSNLNLNREENGVLVGGNTCEGQTAIGPAARGPDCIGPVFTKLVRSQAYSGGDVSKDGPNIRPNEEGIVNLQSENPDEMRSIFDIPHVVSEETVSRVEDSLNLVIEGGEEEGRADEDYIEDEDEAIEDREDIEEGEWVRASRGAKRGSGRKKVPIGSILGNHFISHNRSRSRKGKRNKSKGKIGTNSRKANDRLDGLVEAGISENEVEGANISVSDETIKKLNYREKPAKDAAWVTGKKLGLTLTLKGNEEKLIDKMAEIENQDNLKYEEFRTTV